MSFFLFPGTQLVPTGEREAPPAYDQLFGISNLKQAKRQSPNKATFIVKVCEIIAGTSEWHHHIMLLYMCHCTLEHTHTLSLSFLCAVACGICMVILSALPIAMIVIGKLILRNLDQYTSS